MGLFGMFRKKFIVMLKFWVCFSIDLKGWFLLIFINVKEDYFLVYRYINDLE